MHSIYIGTAKVSNTNVELMISDCRRLVENRGLHSGDILICKSDTQYGTWIQWNLCQRIGAIPFFAAPDFPVEKSDFMKYTDVKHCLEIRNNEELKCYKYENDSKKYNEKYKEIEAGSVIHMTSATTGNPKFILRTKSNLDLEMERYINRTQITAGDIMMSIAPYYHAYAFLGPLLACEKTGATLVFPDIIMPRNIIQLCNNMKVNCLHGIPYFFDKMVEVDSRYQLYDNMKMIVSSGEKLSADSKKNFEQRFGYEPLQQYGSTETGTITICDGNDPEECQGRPLDGVEFKVIQENEKNLIAVNTNGTMGYYIKENIEPIAKEFYETSDVGYFDAEGRLFIEGRCDDIIIRAGEKINLKWIEKTIKKYPGIEAVKVEVEPGELKELACYYSSSIGINEKGLKLYCQKHLSRYQTPRSFTKKVWAQNKSWKNQG
ncbi:MAG: class I adenylate-forming enzyme family protein [Suipraeoptans sp.]